MSRPNIFIYANRELSQDAMVCWLLACLHSENQEYRKIGLNFIRFIFNDETIQDNEVRLESKSPHKQYYHMDVYAVVCLRNKLYPIIFENKTNTYLHSEQFQKYCKDVASWMSAKKNYYTDLSKNMNASPDGWGEIIYVFFKTGYMFGWQKRDFKQQKEMVTSELSKLNVGLCVREIYLEHMVDFLKQQNKDELLEDYFTALEKQKINRDFVLENGLKSVDFCYTALNDENGSNETECAMLFQNIFGDESRFNYNHQHWASKDLFVTTDEQGNKTYYCYRFQWCNYNRGKWAPAFQLQQYRYEKGLNGNHETALKEKTEEAKNIKSLCEKIINNLEHSSIDFRFEDIKVYPCKTYDGQMLMKIFIVNESSPQNVCSFIKVFSDELRKAVKEYAGNSVTLLDYLN